MKRSQTPMFITLVLIATMGIACTAQQVNTVLNEIGSSGGVSSAEVVKGLKQALTIGTNNSAGMASKLDGYNKNQAIRLLFPPEAVKAEKTLRDLGMGKQVDDFVVSMNRAAEDAAKKAAPIFVSAVTGMTIGDGWGILKGADNAATEYLIAKTSAQLKAEFNPVIKNSIEKVGVMRLWNPLASAYNAIPMVSDVNPNLENYITDRAMEGLFTLIADEERKIRKDPSARVTDLLKKVFAQQG